MRITCGDRSGVGRRPETPPAELVLLSRVSIDDLRPWEYYGMGWWDYERLAHAKEELAAARAMWCERGPR